MARRPAGGTYGVYWSGEARGSALPANPQMAGPHHSPMIGTHSHGHSAYGLADPDHDHPHSHGGEGVPDANHNHPHAAPPPGGVHAGVNAGLGMGPNVRPAVDEEEPMAPRSVSGISLEEQIRRFLEGQGVNVDLALESAQTAGQLREQRARGRLRAAGDVAIQLRRAKRALAFEQRGFCERAPGFSIAKVAEAQERVNQLEARLREAALDDPEVIREAKRRPFR